jgi:hypothetical protein
MAFLYITEYPDLPGAYATYTPQVVRDPPIVDQAPVAIAVGAASSAAFNARTRIVRLHCDVVCSILIGPAGSTTATAANARMAANQTEYRMVVAGAGHVVSVITNT